MRDYPDYTDAMQLIGSDIMMPIDIQAAYIMMPVDIQALYLEYLDINIKAATVEKVKVELIAETIAAITVGITAETIGELSIDITAQTVAVYDQPQWASKSIDDKNFRLLTGTLGFNGEEYGTYTVTNGKTLYLCGLSFAIFAQGSTDADKTQIGVASLKNHSDNIVLAAIGGNGGGAINFSKPVPLAENKVFRYYATVMAAHDCIMNVSAWGYEI